MKLGFPLRCVLVFRLCRYLLCFRTRAPIPTQALILGPASIGIRAERSLDRWRDYPCLSSIHPLFLFAVYISGITVFLPHPPPFPIPFPTAVNPNISAHPHHEPSQPHHIIQTEARATSIPISQTLEIHRSPICLPNPPNQPYQ